MIKCLAYIFLLFIPFISLSSTSFFADIDQMTIDKIQVGNVPRDEIVIIEIDDESLKEIGFWPWNRSIYAKAIKQLNKGKPRVVSFDILFLEKTESDPDLQNAFDNADFPVVLGSKFVGLDLKKPVFTGQNLFSGYTNLSSDLDGKIRKGSLINMENCEKSLAYMTFSLYIGNFDCKSSYSDGKISIGNSYIFAYTDKDFQSVSFKDLYFEKIDPIVFKNKIVLIGVSVTDIKESFGDNFIGPDGSSIAGVKIHANIINSFLNRSFYTKLDSKNITAISVLILLPIIIFLSKRNWKIEIAVFIIILILANLIGIICFELKILWPFSEITVFIALSYLFQIISRNIIASRENRFIKKAFAQYLNPILLKKLLKNPEKLNLVGEQKEMTVLFCDIRGFTTLSEKLKPIDLFKLTNNYLNVMSTIILDNFGTIDKFIGDAIMAFWNAPLEDPNHKEKAVKTALEMIDALEKFNKENQFNIELANGIGINTGKMIVGNLGSSKRFDYTVIGDEVNLGSRLEGLTKKYGVRVIVSENVIINLNLQSVIFRHLDTVIVKGKKIPIKIFEPLKDSESNKVLISNYHKAFQLYQAKKFKEAIKIFQQINDGPSNLMIERIRNEKFPDNWDGIYKWEEK